MTSVEDAVLQLLTHRGPREANSLRVFVNYFCELNLTREEFQPVLDDLNRRGKIHLTVTGLVRLYSAVL